MVSSENCLRIPLETEKDAGLARDEARSVGAAMGFNELAQSEIALGVSEICQNAIRHAGGGKATITTLNQDRILRIIIEDKGNGIPNISKAMQEGYSTIPTSLGIGMDVAKRTMDKFKISTTVGEGTSITLEKYLPLPTGILEYGAVSLADEGYEQNGDEYLIKEYDGNKVLLSVIDGLGQGYAAHLMATSVKSVLSENFDLPLEELITLCDQQLKADNHEDSEVAMSLARIEPNKVTYLGVGDTHAYIYKDDLYPLISTEGRVGGQQLRSLYKKEYSLEKGDILILCTDGVQTSLSMQDIPLDYSAQNIANTLFNSYHRAYGDVTVLVVKYLTAYE